MRAVDHLVREMRNRGINKVFGIIGGQIMPLYDAMYNSGIDVYVFRHEQGAMHAADAYGRVMRRPMVVIVTSGPGATNILTGLANAMMDSSPLIAITGQVPTAFFGRDAFQETDIVGSSMPITKHTFMVRRPEDVVPAFKAAYEISIDHRPGPVLIDLPRDVQLMEVDERSFREFRIHRKVIPEPDYSLVSYAVKMLLSAERPVMLVGGGVCWSNATNEALALAELLGMPIVTTLPGKNCVPSNHPLVMGPAGMHGRLEGDAALINADVVLAVGTRFSDRTVGNFREFQRGRKIIHIDIDKSEIGKNVKPAVGIVGDAKTVLSMMIEMIPKALERRNEAFIKWLRSIKEQYEAYREKAAAEFPGFAPWKVLKVLREVMPPHSITVTGVGSHQMWSELHWDVYVPGTFITSAGLGTMGFGIPAALGAKIARPDVPVLDIDGDGSFQMTMQNLALVREYNLPIIIAIFDNSTLMLVRHWQVMLYSRRIIAVDFNVNPDFMKIAEAYGIEGVRPSNYDELRNAVARAVRNNEPLIVDITIDRERDFVLPFVPSGKWLEEVIMPEGFKISLRFGDNQ
ncbi:biosynthetic-type acetolactate synthase large subunit [Vulcanisaeta thermophila]|uniref:biosynthetic-type acetolactate synthase large subunit n=1 Tax=Vulcanisaeta thermophila TaxID=867917 RepID=UPI000853D1E1|nr:biosynthetic-type acetolactate synthase large subunit [Vulcanisaeta thermophila]